MQGDWPFAAGRVPLFYGWIVALLSTLGFLMSIPGQTMGMAVFADEFIREFGLSRTELSTAYLFGTVGSALLLTRAGRWYDQFGARVLLLTASLGLAFTLIFISQLAQLGQWLSAWLAIPLAWSTFPLILLGYFGVRFSGQGVLTSASRNVLLVWFDRRRGLVTGVRGVFVSLGFSLAPVVLALMIDQLDWQGALLWLALIVGLGFSVLVLVGIRDHPDTCGLSADGEPVHQQADQQRVTRTDMSLAQVREQTVFWLYSASLAIHALFGTAVTFHVVAVFEQAGRTREEAFGYFIPQAITSVVVNLGASVLADYIRLKPLLIVMLSAFLLGAYGLTQLQTPLGYVLLVGGLGAGGGLWGVLSNLAFIRQFGALHLGEISGLNTAVTVLASAIGPVLFSLANDQAGSFAAAAYGCIIVLLLLWLAAILLPQPLDRVP